MASGLRFRARCAAGGLALAWLATAPAQAQFMTGSYPVIIVPPPAQTMVMPKLPKPRETPPPAPPSPLPDAGVDQSKCYQGRAKIC